VVANSFPRWASRCLPLGMNPTGIGCGSRTFPTAVKRRFWLVKNSLAAIGLFRDLGACGLIVYWEAGTKAPERFQCG